MTFDNLPNLTSTQAAVVAAMLAPHAGLHDAAEAAGLSLGRLFDHLASPDVQAHVAHARKVLDERLRLRLAAAAHKAVDCLEHIAESHEQPAESLECRVERRRAATAVLRAHMTPRTRRKHIRPRTIDLDRLNTLIHALEAEPADKPAPDQVNPNDQTTPPNAGKQRTPPPRQRSSSTNQQTPKKNLQQEKPPSCHDPPWPVRRG